jgi:hypothetical protein
VVALALASASEVDLDDVEVVSVPELEKGSTDDLARGPSEQMAHEPVHPRGDTVDVHGPHANVEGVEYVETQMKAGSVLRWTVTVRHLRHSSDVALG